MAGADSRLDEFSDILLSAIRKRKGILDTALTIIMVLMFAVYTNLFTSTIDVRAGLGLDALLSGVVALGWWNSAIIVFVIASFGRFYLEQLPSIRIREVRDELIHEVLEAACKSLIYPDMDKHIRAIITVYDPDDDIRRSKYMYNTRPDPERTGEYPPGFGVTGTAFTERRVVIEELEEDHHSEYEDPAKSSVLPEIRTILAAPILRSESHDAKPIGVLAIDSQLSLDKLITHESETNYAELRTTLQMWADILSKLMLVAETEYNE